MSHLAGPDRGKTRSDTSSRVMPATRKKERRSSETPCGREASYLSATRNPDLDPPTDEELSIHSGGGRRKQKGTPLACPFLRKPRNGSVAAGAVNLQVAAGDQDRTVVGSELETRDRCAVALVGIKVLDFDPITIHVIKVLGAFQVPGFSAVFDFRFVINRDLLVGLPTVDRADGAPAFPVDEVDIASR